MADLCDICEQPEGIYRYDPALEVGASICDGCDQALREVWESMPAEDRAAIEADLDAERAYLRGS